MKKARSPWVIGRKIRETEVFRMRPEELRARFEADFDEEVTPALSFEPDDEELDGDDCPAYDDMDGGDK